MKRRNQWWRETSKEEKKTTRVIEHLSLVCQRKQLLKPCRSHQILAQKHQLLQSSPSSEEKPAKLFPNDFLKLLLPNAENVHENSSRTFIKKCGMQIHHQPWTKEKVFLALNLPPNSFSSFHQNILEERSIKYSKAHCQHHKIIPMPARLKISPVLNVKFMWRAELKHAESLEAPHTAVLTFIPWH
jgi:hypothetical protein